MTKRSYLVGSFARGLKGQSHQDLVLFENRMKVSALIRNPLVVA